MQQCRRIIRWIHSTTSKSLSNVFIQHTYTHTHGHGSVRYPIIHRPTIQTQCCTDHCNNRFHSNITAAAAVVTVLIRQLSTTLIVTRHSRSLAGRDTIIKSLLISWVICSVDEGERSFAWKQNRVKSYDLYMSLGWIKDHWPCGSVPPQYAVTNTFI